MRTARQRRAIVGFSVAAPTLVVAGIYLETRLWLVAKFPYFIDEGLLAAYAYDRNKLYSLDQGVRPGLTWFTTAGMWLHIPPLVAIRLAAVLFGLVGLVAGAMLAARFVGRMAAAAFVVLALLTPCLFLYDALGLREPVVSGLVVAAFLLELELARRPSLRTAALLGLCFAGILWVHDLGKIALYFAPLSLVYFPFRSPERTRLAVRWVGCAAVSLLLAFLATVPLRFESSYAQLGETEQKIGATRTVSAFLAHALRAVDASWPGVRDALTGYVTYPVLALALVGLLLGLRRHPRFTALVGIWGLALIAAILSLAATPFPRYFAVVTPFLLLLAAIGVEELAAWVPRPLLVVAVVAALVPALVFDVAVTRDPVSASYPPIDKAQYITGYAAGTGVRQAVDELRSIAHGRQLVVLSDPGKAPLALDVLARSEGPRVEWVWPPNPDVTRATLLLDNGGASPPPSLGSFLEIWRYQRPDGGQALVISEKRS
ncbi:MAG: hypothetical protein JO186_09780 [Actinobacteria bacterium]|nr:hypothetical protein [Actinomycetota bacterium]